MARSAYMITVGQLGTFNVENYGDLLYPLIFRLVLERYKPQVTVRPYSFLSGSAPLEAGFGITALGSLFDPTSSSPGRLVIGGGDILRTDWNRVGVHHRRAHRAYFGKLLSSLGPVNSFSYLFSKQLSPAAALNFFGNRFRARWMNYPGSGPFLIDPDDLPDDSRICYLSCGVPFELTPAEMTPVSRLLDKACFIYVRDEQSREKLRRAGVSREINVAPDLVVTLSDYYDHAAEAQKGRCILSKWGVSRNAPVLCFQGQPDAQDSADEIIKQLLRYRQRNNSEIVLLPLGYCHHDHVFLASLAKKSAGAFKYIGVYSVSDMISVIAACNMFVGTSLHGNITAFSFGIPHVYGAMDVAKSEGFLHEVNLPTELKLQTWSEMNDKLDLVAAKGKGFFSERAEKAKVKVYRVVDRLLAELLKEDRPRAS